MRKLTLRLCASVAMVLNSRYLETDEKINIDHMLK